MAPCKFFLEGRCRFGANCRNEHIQVHNSSYQQSPVHQTPNKQYFQQQPKQYPSRGNDQNFQDPKPESLLHIVKEDANCAIYGGQWLFSCYAPQLRKLMKSSYNSNGENLPNLIDYSPDELRWEAVSSCADGKFQEYNLNLQQLSQTYLSIQKALQNPDSATGNFIIGYERGENVNPAGTALGGLSMSLPVSNAAKEFSFSLPPSQQQQQPTAPLFRFQMPSQQQPVPSSSFSFQQTSSGVASFSFQLPEKIPTQQLGPPPFRFELPAQVQQQQSLINSIPSQNYGPSASPNEKTVAVLPSLQNLNHLQLNASDVEQFKAEKFSFGKIPRIPPPKELC